MGSHQTTAGRELLSVVADDAVDLRKCFGKLVSE